MAEVSFACNDGPPTEWEPITDGQTDIAMTGDMDKVKVELIGRQPLQKVWLWTGASENSEGNEKTSSYRTTNKQYKPETDGPGVAGLPDGFPTDQELVPHKLATKYLEVGLVIGEEPQRMKETHKTRTKESRLTLARDSTALRAFLSITPYVTKQDKYYVGWDRCYPLTVDSDYVFFYAEFWHGLPENANKKQRRDFINTATKCHAAVNESADDLSTAAITVSDADERTESDPLVVTQPENVASTLLLQLTLYMDTRNRDYLNSMLRVIEDAAPGLRSGPFAGIVAFYDFEGKLREKDAKSVKRELKAGVPQLPDLDVAQIQVVHRILQNNGWGGHLPYNNLAFFLEYCHDQVFEESEEEFGRREVESALRAVNIHHKYQNTRAIDEEPINENSDHVVLEGLRDIIEFICDYIRDPAKSLAEKYGGMLKHRSIRDLINKFGNAVDIAHQQGRWEQLRVLQEVQYASEDVKATEKLKELKHHLETLLKARLEAADAGGEGSEA